MDIGRGIEYVYMGVLALAIFIYYYRQYLKGKKPQALDEPKKVNSDGNEFIEALVDLDYFRWVDVDRVEDLSSEMKQVYESFGELATIEQEAQPVCYRLYPADEEDLFEEGGIKALLELLMPAFEKRGLQLIVEEVVEEYEDNIANQWVVVNGRKYVIYDNLDGRSANWSMATSKVLNLLNEELKLQNATERVYSIRGGNDHQFLFLNSDQFNFLSHSKLRQEDRPRN